MTKLPSSSHYRSAFEAIEGELSAKQRAMLKAHYQATQHTLRTDELATAARYRSHEKVHDHYGDVHDHYGDVGRLLCEKLKFKPTKKYRDGSTMWGSVLAKMIIGQSDKFHTWKMRPEVVQALSELGWFDDHTGGEDDDDIIRPPPRPATKYRFRWDAFDDETVKELAAACGFDSLATGTDPRSWLGDKVKRPNDQFVRRTFDSLLRTPWLCTFRGLAQIVDQLHDRNIGPMRAPRSQQGYVDYIRDCRNGKTLRRILFETMIRFGDAGSADPEALGDGWVRKFAVLIPGEQPRDQREAHPYQKEAWDRLSAKLAEFQATDVFQGLLVMPTGSGKTFTAVRWLVENIINRRGRVLWVAHRYELLEQAAEAFDRAIYLAEPKDRRIKRRIVSGKHCATSEICPDDDILICSVASLARRPDIVDRVLTDHFLVIDEAHHAPAKSYRDLIQRVNGQGRKRVLGLTATPTRTVESERPELSRLFGQQPLYEVRVRDLIDQQYLAKPVPISVQTGAEVERGITPDDLKHLKQFRDLTPEWQERIATLESRNRLIVEHYLQNREKYGKTLIFAINVLHAEHLVEAFNDKGVAAASITSYHYVGNSGTDSEAADHKAILERFRDAHSGLDVLVNVMILTEGVDVPGIQTVFLTRPTQSEILLRQMVGRALRGPKAGGTFFAYLVSFEDHWVRFRELESPFERLPDICPPVETRKPVEAEIPEVLVDLAESESLPYEMIQAAAAELRRLGGNQPIDVFESVPHGWFILERPTEAECEEEQDAARQRIHVYAHQKACWDALIDYLESSDDQVLSHSSASDLFAEYFGDCDAPKPSDHSLVQLFQHYRAGGEKPIYFDMVDRTRVDPHEVARRVHVDKADKFALIEESFRSSLVKAIYGSRRDYVAAIDQALYDFQYPDEVGARVQPGIPIFEPRSDQQLRPPSGPGPAHDLDDLMRGVLGCTTRFVIKRLCGRGVGRFACFAEFARIGAAVDGRSGGRLAIAAALRRLARTRISPCP